MNTKKVNRRVAEPRVMYAVRVPVEAAKRVQAAANKWGVATTTAAGQLLQIGLEAEAGALDQDAELQSIGFALAAIAERLDRLDKLAEVAARAALKSGMVALHQLKVSGSVPEALKRLDAAVESTIEEARK